MGYGGIVFHHGRILLGKFCHYERPWRSQRPPRPTDIIYHRSPRSKRPRTERAHIPTIPTPAERERQAALHTGPHRAAKGASSSSPTSLPGSAAGPLPGGQHATDTRPREPAADQRPALGVRGQPSQHPHPRAGRDDTGPGHGHRPPDQPGPCTTGFPTAAATRPNRQGAEDAPQQREHDASGGTTFPYFARAGEIVGFFLRAKHAYKNF